MGFGEVEDQGNARKEAMIVRAERDFDSLDDAVNLLFRGEPLPPGWIMLTGEQVMEAATYKPPKRKKKKDEPGRKGTARKDKRSDETDGSDRKMDRESFDLR